MSSYDIICQPKSRIIKTTQLLGFSTFILGVGMV